jgi:uncharacterized protein (TIGR02246 family)
MKNYASVIALVVALNAPAMAQSDDPHKAMNDLITSYVAAYNKHDVAGVGRFWSQDGVFVPPTGAPVIGREAIEKMFASRFDADGGTERSVLNTTQMVDAHTILATGEAFITPSRGPNAGKEGHVRWLGVDVEEHGAWHVKALSIHLVPTAESAAAK